MNFLVYFLKIMAYTVGALITCGILVYILNKLYCFLMSNSEKIWIASSYVGTPIHELGHALMCVIFFHKINEIKLYTKESDNTLGYVRHSYNKKNIYHQIGNFFIGLGPVFSGFLVISGILWLFFKEPTMAYLANSINEVDMNSSIFAIFANAYEFLYSLVIYDTKIYIKIISFLLISAISLHVNLSIPDVKISLIGFSYYTLAALIFSGITYKLGMTWIIGKLEMFCLASCALFSIIIMFSIINVIFALVIFTVKKFLEN